MYATSRTRMSDIPRRTLTPSADADVWTDVARAFETAIVMPCREAMFALRVAATVAAGSTRRLGVPPERAVMALKAAVARHDASGWSPSFDTNPSERHKESFVYAKLFTWFVAAFYDD
jgi:hypothetical protein